MCEPGCGYVRVGTRWLDVRGSVGAAHGIARHSRQTHEHACTRTCTRTHTVQLADGSRHPDQIRHVPRCPRCRSMNHCVRLTCSKPRASAGQSAPSPTAPCAPAALHPTSSSSRSTWMQSWRPRAHRPHKAVRSRRGGGRHGTTTAGAAKGDSQSRAVPGRPRGPAP